MKILELGCGMKKTAGAIGVDINPKSLADVIHDLNKPPLPFADDQFDKVICDDVLEHVDDFVKVVEDIWRVAKAGAVVEVSGPFMSSVNFFSDPTHKRAFTSRSFDYFIPGTQAAGYRYSGARFRLISVRYDKNERYRNPVNQMLLRLANRFKARYERRFAFLFPVYQIYFELAVVK